MRRLRRRTGFCVSLWDQRSCAREWGMRETRPAFRRALVVFSPLPRPRPLRRAAAILWAPGRRSACATRSSSGCWRCGAGSPSGARMRCAGGGERAGSV